MKREVILGWECSVQVDGVRRVRELISLVTATWSFERGLSAAPNGIPTRVLGWLIKPLLRTAYAEGWADRGGTFNPTQIPRVYVDDDT